MHNALVKYNSCCIIKCNRVPPTNGTECIIILCPVWDFTTGINFQLVDYIVLFIPKQKFKD